MRNAGAGRMVRPRPTVVAGVVQRVVDHALRAGVRYCARISRHRARSARASVSAEATYLVTGGLGGLGLEAAKSLVKLGARHLALMGRREPSPEASAAIDELRGTGVDVVVVSADVADRARLHDALASIRATMPPLRGIVHAAGVLDDGVVGQLDAHRMDTVLRPKLDGAWHLHELTMGDELDVFVLYSSTSSVLGAAGQALSQLRGQVPGGCPVLGGCFLEYGLELSLQTSIVPPGPRFQTVERALRDITDVDGRHHFTGESFTP